MNGERRVDATLPVGHRYEHDREHDWLALERFADLASRTGLDVAVGDFMWMGAAEFGDGRIVHSYKHIDTRRHLHLDGSAHAYRYRPTAEGGRYDVIPDPRLAINLALGLDVISRHR
ncbi:MAG: hypothetical protein AB7V43_13920 [Acidimicrobiia bacterium]